MDNRFTTPSVTKFLAYYPGAMLVYFVLYFTVGHWFGIGEFSWAHVVPVLFLGILPAIWLVAAAIVKLWAVLVLLFAVGLAHLFAGMETVQVFYSEYGSWLGGSLGDTLQYHTIYLGIQLAGMVICAYAIWLLVLAFQWTKGIVLVAIPVGILVADFAGYVVSAKAVLFLLMFFFYLLIFFTSRYWVKNGEKERSLSRTKESMVFLTPVLLVMTLLLLVLPERQEPFRWDFVRNFVDRATKQVITWVANWDVSIGQNDFAMSMTGFSEEEKLRDKTNGKSKECLDLFLEVKPESNLYLTESVWTSFDGREWQEEVPVTQSESKMDLMETMYAVNRMDLGVRDDYLQQSVVKVTMRYFHTDHTLLPLKTVYYGQQQNLLDGDMYGYGSSYEARYYRLNLSHPMFTTLLETDLEEEETVWEKLSYSLREGSREYTLEDLYQYRARIKETYLADEIDDARIDEWLETVCGEEENIYEKLLRIEEALWQFTYTTTPGRMPEEVTDSDSFLTYFLLEKQEGFCTYYATAFVLLSRHLGLPARYCRGFMVESAGLQEVSAFSSDMHAWPEVYFEGVGWIPFEPTPGYATTRYTPWAEKKIVNTKDDVDWSEFYRHLEEVNATRMEEQEKVGESKKEQFFDPAILMTAGKILLAVVMLFLFALVLVLCFLAFVGKRVAHQEGVSQFEWLYKHCITGYGKLGLVREESETLLEFELRLADAGYASATMRWKNALTYSSVPFSEKDLEDCLAEVERICSHLEEIRGERLYVLSVKLSKYWYSKERNNDKMKQ